MCNMFPFVSACDAHRRQGAEDSQGLKHDDDEQDDDDGIDRPYKDGRWSCPKMALSESMFGRPTHETIASGSQTSWQASPIVSSVLQARRRMRGRPSGPPFLPRAFYPSPLFQ